MKILLLEPSYKNKYPPLALMKISTYHKLKGDTVCFCKGLNKKLASMQWDRIYISSVFTFHYKKVVETIEFYYESVAHPNQIFLGGSMATIMQKNIKEEAKIPGITIILGLLDQVGILGDDDIIIDELIPDYSIISNQLNQYLNYDYPLTDAYFMHATRGCVRKCDFCAVPKIEPEFKAYCDIKPRINKIIEEYGQKKDLMIMDNNILASPQFDKIINDIIDCGFGVSNNWYQYEINGKKYKKRRYVDFNQGLDARLIFNSPEKLVLISKVAVKPLRIAFDHATDEFVEIYVFCMRLAAELKIPVASNYILFNFDDTPNDLYTRLRINVQLNKEFEEKGLKTCIWSFPMRFSPLYGEHATNRKFIGDKWSKKQIRGIQCILNATHGIVGPKLGFFEKAFGKDLNEFNELLLMPEEFIIYRKKNEDNGNLSAWKNAYNSLFESEKMEFFNIIKNNEKALDFSSNKKIQLLLNLY